MIKFYFWACCFFGFYCSPKDEKKGAKEENKSLSRKEKEKGGEKSFHRASLLPAAPPLVQAPARLAEAQVPPLLPGDGGVDPVGEEERGHHSQLSFFF